MSRRRLRVAAYSVTGAGRRADSPPTCRHRPVILLGMRRQRGKKRRILEAIRANPEATQQEIADIARCHRSTVARHDWRERSGPKPASAAITAPAVKPAAPESAEAAAGPGETLPAGPAEPTTTGPQSQGGTDMANLTSRLIDEIEELIEMHGMAEHADDDGIALLEGCQAGDIEIPVTTTTDELHELLKTPEWRWLSELNDLATTKQTAS